MKLYSLIAAALLAVLNGLLLIPAMSAYTFPIAALALALAIALLCFPSSARAKPPRQRRHRSSLSRRLPHLKIKQKQRWSPLSDSSRRKAALWIS